MTKTIMIQGAGSNVGKSMLVAGLARAYHLRGMKVRPFKPQNMSNNAAVTVDGGEIGRAQALQARACYADPTTDMNPVLLKPESEIGAQIIVQGKRIATLKARDFAKMKGTLMGPILDSFNRLKTGADLVIVEGAGSPAEINLRPNDLANMGFAQAANVPVILVGDIDRGGVIAQIVGTKTVLGTCDRKIIKGFVINKFRGDPGLFEEGLQEIVSRTNWPSFGVLPWFADAWRLPAEDVMDIATHKGGSFKIAVPKLPRIANFDDLDPLAAEPDVSVEIIQPGTPLPGDADLVLLPGSKSTIADLADFRAQGWDVDLKAHVRRGGHVMGICGGYQMLGTTITDKDGIEGSVGEFPGLGLLDIETVMTPEKHLNHTHAVCLESGEAITGYEIHIGDTHGADCNNPWLQVGDAPTGAASSDGRIKGCYLHGLFSSDGFRHHYLRSIRSVQTELNYEKSVDDTLDALARHLEDHLDLDAILTAAE